MLDCWLIRMRVRVVVDRDILNSYIADLWVALSVSLRMNSTRAIYSFDDVGAVQASQAESLYQRNSAAELDTTSGSN